ncbi:MAG: hypothetical protein EA381_17825 [Planctomycetaceae bacterium]|nr:MAG: hypothetical protein EA381_17825 [Planctomycetaceae bacterium]
MIAVSVLMFTGLPRTLSDRLDPELIEVFSATNWLSIFQQTEQPPAGRSPRQSRRNGDPGPQNPFPVRTLLEDAASRAIVWGPVEAIPTDRQLEESAKFGLSAPQPTESVDRLPTEPPATVELRAPVVRIEEELAGLAWDSEDQTDLPEPQESHFRTVANTSTGVATDAPNPSVDAAAIPAKLAGPQPARAVSSQWMVGDLGADGARQFVGDLADAQPAGADPASRKRHGLGGGWPATPSLMADLQRLELQLASRAQLPMWTSHDGTRQPPQGGYDVKVRPESAPRQAYESPLQRWQLEVTETLQRLQRLPSISSPQSSELLDRLDELARQGSRAAERMGDRESQVLALRTAHALSRRVAVWRAARRAMLVGEDDRTLVHTAPQADLASQLPANRTDALGVNLRSRAELSQRIGRVLADAADSADARGWSQFLLLDELTAASRDPDETRLRLAAQRFLSRLDWVGLTEQQSKWLRRVSIEQLAAVVRPWAVGPVDYAALLSQLERQEADAIDLGAIEIARAAQSLRYASSPEAAELASAIDLHYRNANVRVSVSDQWLQRMLPEVDARVQPVRQRILGSDVRGHSRIRSTVAVRFVPSPDSWKLHLESTGDVISDTASRSGPVSIRSGSQAGFVSTTPLEIRARSAEVETTRVDVDSQTKVRAIDTDYDGVPLLRELIREIAWNRYQSLAPIAKRIQHGQIEEGVGVEVDRQIRSQVDGAADKLSRHFVGPLGSLGLKPTVLDMQTTDNRLVARYRIGGDWQLTAFTPRPRAPADSLLSLQVHQSALNNVLESILPTRQASTVEDLLGELTQRFGVDLAATDDLLDADDLAGDTTIQFAPTRPVTVEIEDDLVWITLRVVRLHRPGAIDLRRLVVRAAYRPEIDGMAVRLVRDAHLEISGPRLSMRERLPARAIFNKVFSPNRPLELIPTAVAQLPAMAGLSVRQFELRDGWIGIAFGPAGGDSFPEVVAEIAATPTPPSRFRWVSWR